VDHSLETIKNIFYSGTHSFRFDRELISNVCFLLKNNLLTVESKTIASIGKYRSYTDDIANGRVASIDIAGGQIEHLALKLIGRDYLVSSGFQEVEFEAQFVGYFPDVITKDRKCIVECGLTNPDKIFNYFKNKSVVQIIIIPYPNPDTKKLVAYVFSPTIDLAEFLIFKEQEDLKKATRHRT